MFVFQVQERPPGAPALLDIRARACGWFLDVRVARHVPQLEPTQQGCAAGLVSTPNLCLVSLLILCLRT